MLSIYIHIPFCIKKCNYCDFLSFSAPEDLRERYAAALCNEIRLYSEVLPADRKDVYTIFFGGGTPSLLTPDELNRIMRSISDGFRVTDGAEISLECNPGTADEDKLRSYRDIGINRLSIGLQSADDRELKILGRIHDHEQFKITYNAARRAGFKNLNVDIISAIPGQTVESYGKTLTEVVNSDPEHISAYSLIIEEGTKFHDLYAYDRSVTSACTGKVCRPDDIMMERNATEKDKAAYADPAENLNDFPPLPNEEDERRMYYLTREILEKAGYHRYEISNYSKPGYECRHNNVYWTGGHYIGLGLGASSYIYGIRYKNPADIDRYLRLYGEVSGVRPGGGDDAGTGAYSDAAAFYKDGTLHEEIDELSLKDKMEEYMFLGLRRMEGIGIGTFTERFGRDIFDVYGRVLEKAQSDGLLERTGDRIALTDRGIDVSNVVLSNFLLD